jgi:hypothetical protein
MGIFIWNLWLISPAILPEMELGGGRTKKGCVGGGDGE